MVAELAGWDPVASAQIERWPLRDALLAFEAILRRRAHESYERALDRYAAIAPHNKDARPPAVPPILRD